jgi:hypothetical protein
LQTLSDSRDYEATPRHLKVDREYFEVKLVMELQGKAAEESVMYSICVEKLKCSRKKLLL